MTHIYRQKQTKTSNHKPASYSLNQKTFQQAPLASDSLDHNRILQLQSIIGNRAVQRLFALNKPHTPKLQTKPHIQTIQSPSKSIQYKLSGNADAMATIEPRKKKKLKSKWQTIIKNLIEYEKLEQKATDENQKKQLALIKTIAPIINTWIKENEVHVAAYHDGQSENLRKKIETDAKKMSALIILQGRVSEEQRVLLLKETNSDYTNKRAHKAGGSVSGGDVSNISKITYGATDTEAEEQGFFQDETDYYDGEENAGYKTGIPQHNPNFGARAIAMGRIDQLITDRLKKLAENQGLNIQPMLVKTQFATRTDDKDGQVTPGIFLEKAEGEEMGGKFLSKGNAAVPDSELPTSNPIGSKDTLLLDDPMLMRSLNKLQILDALCGQVDRHTGNYFVLTDDNGDVIGVQGIDNDMSFGKDITDPDDPKIRELIADKAWRGLPMVIDSQMKEVVMDITDEEVLRMLAGLLSKKEIESTIARFNATRAFFDKLDFSNLISPEQWKKEKAQLFAMQKYDQSYVGMAKGESIKKLLSSQLQLLEHTTELEKTLLGYLSPEQVKNRKIKMGIGKIISEIQNAVLPDLMTDLGMKFGEAIEIGNEIAVSCLEKLDVDQMATDGNQKTEDKIRILVAELYLEQIANHDKELPAENPNMMAEHT